MGKVREWISLRLSIKIFAISLPRILSQIMSAIANTKKIKLLINGEIKCNITNSKKTTYCFLIKVYSKSLTSAKSFKDIRFFSYSLLFLDSQLLDNHWVKVQRYTETSVINKMPTDVLWYILQIIPTLVRYLNFYKIFVLSNMKVNLSMAW